MKKTRRNLEDKLTVALETVGGIDLVATFAAGFYLGYSKIKGNLNSDIETYCLSLPVAANMALGGIIGSATGLYDGLVEKESLSKAVLYSSAGLACGATAGGVLTAVTMIAGGYAGYITGMLF